MEQIERYRKDALRIKKAVKTNPSVYKATLKHLDRSYLTYKQLILEIYSSDKEKVRFAVSRLDIIHLQYRNKIKDIRDDKRDQDEKKLKRELIELRQDLEDLKKDVKRGRVGSIFGMVFQLFGLGK